MTGPNPTRHVVSEEAWREQAKCKGLDGSIFFPERGDMVSVRKAKALCALCPVAQECVDYAVRWDIRWGIFGGLSDHERRPLRREYKAQHSAIRHGTATGYKAHRSRGEDACGACKEANAAHQRRMRAQRAAS